MYIKIFIIVIVIVIAIVIITWEWDRSTANTQRGSLEIEMLCRKRNVPFLFWEFFILERQEMQSWWRYLYWDNEIYWSDRNLGVWLLCHHHCKIKSFYDPEKKKKRQRHRKTKTKTKTYKMTKFSPVRVGSGQPSPLLRSVSSYINHH